MPGTTGNPRPNGERAASVQRLKAAMAERKQSRERREAGKRTTVEIETGVSRRSVIAVRKRDSA